MVLFAACVTIIEFRFASVCGKTTAGPRGTTAAARTRARALCASISAAGCVALSPPRLTHTVSPSCESTRTHLSYVPSPLPDAVELLCDDCKSLIVFSPSLPIRSALEYFVEA